MSQKTNKTNKNSNAINPISNMNDTKTNYMDCNNSLVDSTHTTSKKQTSKKKNGATDCK